MAKARIMVVEDDAIVVAHLERALPQLGYGVVAVVASGEEAIDQAKALGPDLVLMDIRLRGEMTGIEAAERIRVRLDVPVIYLTAYADEALLQQAKVTEPYGYLAKPIRDKELHASIEMALYKHKLDWQLKDLNQILHALRNINHLITRERDPQRVLTEACKILVQTRGYLLVWIGQTEGGHKRVVPVVRSGLGLDYLDSATFTWDESQTGHAPCGIALRTRQTAVCQDIAMDVRYRPWKEMALARGFASSAAVPMIHGTRLFGVLGVYADHQQAFDTEEVDLLVEFADNLALALDGVEQERERKQAEEQIREQAQLLNLAQDAIVVRDLDDNIRFWNKGAEKLYGWTATEAIGQKATQLLDQETTRFEAAKKQLLDNGEFCGEFCQLTKDAQELIVHCRWTLVQDAQGNPKSILAINTDITAKKKLETQFLRAQRVESIGRLAGGIAHDLNNILTPIMLAVPVLRAELKSESARSILDTLESSVQRGADIVKQLLTFARGIEGQKVPLQPRYLINDMVKIIREIFPKSLSLKVELPTNLWLVSGDATQLHQVLMNLCVNARDAMPEGGALTLMAENVWLDENYTCMMPDAQAGPHVMFLVADTGVGIPSEIIDEIFDPFFTTKELGKGTGLGLSTVLGIVKNHGGFIQVVSQVGKGSQFWFYLPAMAGSEPPSLETAADSLPQGRGELILVVEDENAIRTVFEQILKKNGYRVLTASDGMQAVELYAKYQAEIQVVLTDLSMPFMDGLATIHALRSMNPQIRIIVASGLGSSTKVEEVPALNVQGFLPKPFATASLLKTLRQVLQGTIKATGGSAIDYA